jgi:hypothetical protein
MKNNLWRFMTLGGEVLRERGVLRARSIDAPSQVKRNSNDARSELDLQTKWKRSRAVMRSTKDAASARDVI